MSQIGTRIQISATPIDFLEAFAALRFQSTSDDQGDPKAIDIVGDLNLGLKAFMPAKPDRILSFGGARQRAHVELARRRGTQHRERRPRRARNGGLHAPGEPRSPPGSRERRVPLRRLRKPRRRRRVGARQHSRHPHVAPQAAHHAHRALRTRHQSRATASARRSASKASFRGSVLSPNGRSTSRSIVRATSAAT